MNPMQVANNVFIYSPPKTSKNSIPRQPYGREQRGAVSTEPSEIGDKVVVFLSLLDFSFVDLNVAEHSVVRLGFPASRISPKSAGSWISRFRRNQRHCKFMLILEKSATLKTPITLSVRRYRDLALIELNGSFGWGLLNAQIG